MEITPSLLQMGLSSAEATVYTALLQIDNAPVSVIAKNAGIKRPTCYLVLDTLKEKELVSSITIGGKLHYKIEHPAKITTLLSQKVALSKSLVPMLLALWDKDTLSPKVTLYEGKSQVESLYIKIMTDVSAPTKPPMLWFSNWDILHQTFGADFEKNLKKIQKLKVNKREIVIDSPNTRALLAEYGYRNFTYRFVPKNQAVDIDFGIIGNRVVLISASNPLFALSIEHKQIAHSMTALFELAWKGAEVRG